MSLLRLSPGQYRPGNNQGLACHTATGTTTLHMCVCMASCNRPRSTLCHYSPLFGCTRQGMHTHIVVHTPDNAQTTQIPLLAADRCASAGCTSAVNTFVRRPRAHVALYITVPHLCVHGSLQQARAHIMPPLPPSWLHLTRHAHTLIPRVHVLTHCTQLCPTLVCMIHCNRLGCTSCPHCPPFGCTEPGMHTHNYTTTQCACHNANGYNTLYTTVPYLCVHDSLQEARAHVMPEQVRLCEPPADLICCVLQLLA
jgi:hypothetical protein